MSMWPLLSVLLAALAASVLVAMLMLVWRLRTQDPTAPSHALRSADAAAGGGAVDRQGADRLQVVAARLAQVRQRLADAAQARQDLARLAQPTDAPATPLTADSALEDALAQARAALDDQADALQLLAQWYALRSAGPWPSEAQCLQLATTPLSDLGWRLQHHLDETETRRAAVNRLHRVVATARPAGPLHQRICQRLLGSLQNWEATERARGDAWRALARDPDARETVDLAGLAARPDAPVDDAVLTALVSDIASLDQLTGHPWMRGAAQTSDAVGTWHDSLVATRDELQSRVEAFLEMDELLGDALDEAPRPDAVTVEVDDAPPTQRDDATQPAVQAAVAVSRASVLLVAFGCGAMGCGPDDANASSVDASPAADTRPQDTSDAAPDEDTTDEGPPSPGPDADTSDAPDEDALAWYTQTVCAAQAAYECRAWAACGCPDALLSDAGCASAVTTRCAERAAAALGGSRPPVRVDRANSEACAAGLAALPVDCGPPLRRLPVAACASALLVDRDVSERCVLDDAPCADGRARCRAGACTAMPARGEPCLAADLLDDGCAIEDVCVQGRCVAPPWVGEACETPDHCPLGTRCVAGTCTTLANNADPCDADRPCAAGLRCSDGRCVAGDPVDCSAPGPSDVCGNEGLCGAPVSMRCTAQQEAGAACSADDQCAAPLVCAQGRCALGPQADEPCVEGATCGVGFACDFSGERCLPLPQQGELCALGPRGPHQCDDGLGCVAGRCAPMPQDGQPCTTDARCAAGLGCHFADPVSRCAPPNAVGEPCQNDSMCAAGGFCDFAQGRCAADYAQGEACSLGNECGTAGACLPQPDGSFRCGPLPCLEEPCLLACQPGLWCQTRRGTYACYPARCERAP